jgi:hypothetical protein
MHEGSDMELQEEGAKLWERFFAAQHAVHGESASRHALLRACMRSIAESLVSCRFKLLNGGAGAVLLALEHNLRQLLQRTLSKVALQMGGASVDRCVSNALSFLKRILLLSFRRPVVPATNIC